MRPIPRRAVVIGLVAVAAGGATVAALGAGGGDEPVRPAAGPTTAEVIRETLVDFEQVDGALSYGEVIPLRYPAAPSDGGGSDGADATGGGRGIVTWLPPAGSIVERGGPLLRVDDRPVILLYGALPAYRTLAIGTKGRDVRQLEENLRALRYSGFTVDDSFSDSTASAVRAWQKAVGRDETGSVTPEQAVYLPGPVRVASLPVRVGDRADGEVLRYTGIERAVTLDLPTRLGRYATIGATVAVVLPDGKTVNGTVHQVGGGPPSTEDATRAGDPTVPVLIGVPDQAALGGLREGTVAVRFVAEERKDVFTVPVVALVALAEGGYGLQVVEGASTRYIAVEPGLFARGRVEVRGPEVRAGLRVVVPG